MFREQMINFLQAAVVFLLATNAASVLAALYAMRLAKLTQAQGSKSAIERRLDAILRRPADLAPLAGPILADHGPGGGTGRSN